MSDTEEIDSIASLSKLELVARNATAEKAPGVQEMMALYSYYQSLEKVSEPARRMMQARSISSVSNGAYPALAR